MNKMQTDFSEIIRKRKEKFEEYKIIKEKELKEKISNPKKFIKVGISGEKREGIACVITPWDLLENKGSKESKIVAKVMESDSGKEWKMWDLKKPLEEDCEVEFLLDDDKNGKKEAKEVMWHSCSHLLGYAIEQCCLKGIIKSKEFPLMCNGPAIDEGFYYDVFLGENFSLDKSDVSKVEKMMQLLVNQKDFGNFERIEVSIKQAQELFNYNKFKLRNLSKISENEQISVYRCGDFVDLCCGPHVPSLEIIGREFVLHKNSSAYWENNQENESLQRIYGMRFREGSNLKEFVKNREMMKQRGHKHIGKIQHLWFNHKYAPGMIFFQPKGTLIYNRMIEFMREEQKRRGFLEVQSPNIFHKELFQISGHWENYPDMYKISVDGGFHGIKPMNCPGHCLIYQRESRSYKDLPLRMSEYGVCHRNELKGALVGMTRVRRFCQDDAHIFIRQDQIESEIFNCLNFMDSVYKVFNVEYKLYLSTKPKEKFIGKLENWKSAEEQLKRCILEFIKSHPNTQFEVDNEGGAFYGPKIDIKINDFAGRELQCATIQLDYNLPERFKLKYIGNIKEVDNGEKEDQEGDSKNRPVMIHRAIFGSMERFISVICENYAGKWPFWLSPTQIVIIGVKDIPLVKDYCSQIQKVIHEFSKMKIKADVDDDNNRLNKKIMNASSFENNYNYLIVVGEKDFQHSKFFMDKLVHIRMRGVEKDLGSLSIRQLLFFLNHLLQNKPLPDPNPIEFFSQLNNNVNDKEIGVSFVKKDEEKFFLVISGIKSIDSFSKEEKLVVSRKIEEGIKKIVSAEKDSIMSFFLEQCSKDLFAAVLKGQSLPISSYFGIFEIKFDN